MRRRIGLWSLLGFGVGAFWVAAAFVFFTAPQSAALEAAKIVAAITCPPLMFADIFIAPVLNAAIYAGVAFIWFRVAERSDKDVGPAA